jgi:hypothetical protein
MRSRTSCRVPDVSALFRDPTAPHLAVFILRSVGRVASRPWPHHQNGRTIKRGIMASTRMISAQRDCQLVCCLLAASQLQDQATAIRLRPDRGPARRPMCRSASLALQETRHSTNPARGDRTSSRVQSELQGRQESAFPTRRRLSRNTRPSACRSRCVPLLNGRSDGICESGVGPIPRAAISRDRAIDRVGLRRCLTALSKLRDRPCSKSDVRARCEHRSGCRSRRCRQSRQPDSDAIAVRARCPRFADRVLCCWKHARQALSGH